MSVAYKLPRGTRAALNAKATAGTIVAGQPYLITDEGRIAVGLTTTTYQDFAKPGDQVTPGQINRYSANDLDVLTYSVADGTWEPKAVSTLKEPLQQNFQTGTAYTPVLADNNKVVDLANAAAIAVTLAKAMQAGFSCTFTLAGAGQATFAPESGASMHSNGGLTKSAGQWTQVTAYVRTNAGGSAAEWVLAGLGS